MPNSNKRPPLKREIEDLEAFLKTVNPSSALARSIRDRIRYLKQEVKDEKERKRHGKEGKEG